MQHPSVRTFLTCLGAAFWLLAGPVQAQPAPGFAAYDTGDRLALRIDALPEGDYIGTDYSIDGGPAQPVARDQREGQRLVLLPAAQGVIRLRGRFLDGDRIVPGDWSAPQPVAAAVKAGPPGQFAPEDWEIGPDPEAADTLRLRLNRLPDGDGKDGGVQAVRLRRDIWSVAADLMPVTGVWQKVTLDRAQVARGQAASYDIAALAGGRSGRWSAPKTAATAHPAGAPQGVPSAPLAWDWFLRPDGTAGGAVLELAVPVYDNGAPVTGIEVRTAPMGDLYAAEGGWSGWRTLGAPGADGRGRFRIGDLPQGDTLVEIRALNALGPGPAAARKMVRPRAFGLPARAMLGDLNPPGSGAIRIPKGVQLVQVRGGRMTDWRVVAGEGAWDHVVPTRAGDRLSPARLEFSDGHEVEIRLAPRTFTATTANDILEFLKIPSRAKSGATLLVGPEWIDLSQVGEAFGGAFSGLDRPLVMRPAEPENGTLVSNWTVSEWREGVAAGRLHVEDMTFYAPMALGLDTIFGFAGAGAFRDVTLDRVTILSDVMPARFGAGYRQEIRAVALAGGEDTAVRDSEIAHVVYGISTGGKRARVSGNRVHDLAADPLNIHYRRGSAERPTLLEDIRIEGNTAWNYIGDTWRLHGDALHMWMFGAGKDPENSRIDRLVLRGNINFPGREGMLSPPTITPRHAPRHVDASGPLRADDDRRILRVDASAGPVTITLPPVALTPGLARDGKVMSFTVQKWDLSPNPVLVRGGTFAGEMTRAGPEGAPDLARPYDAVTLSADPEAGVWQTIVPGPEFQGLFADQNEVPLTGLVIEDNILWGTAANQILLQNRPGPDAVVRRNSVLPVLPGDTDGDGRYNTTGDGAGRYPLWIRMRGAQVADNIAARVEPPPDDDPAFAPRIGRNETYEGRGPAWMAAHFPGIRHADPSNPESLVWLPATREEAIALARPAPGARADGALAPDPAGDAWNFTLNRAADIPARPPADQAKRPANPDHAGVP